LPPLEELRPPLEELGGMTTPLEEPVPPLLDAAPDDPIPLLLALLEEPMGPPVDELPEPLPEPAPDEPPAAVPPSTSSVRSTVRAPQPSAEAIAITAGKTRARVPLPMSLDTRILAAVASGPRSFRSPAS
jgi:hypothetical protein